MPALHAGVHPLENTIQEYAWGSRHVLARLLGEPEPAPRPQAELWIGAHPKAPSTLCLPAGRCSLLEAVAREPEIVLGIEGARRHAARFPFLLKILAVERPLSIQAHPDAEQARRGFAREEAAGIPHDAPARSYRDDGDKPELVCALEPFRLLKGFRPWADVEPLWRELALPRPEVLHQGAELEDLFRFVMHPDRARRAALLGAARRGAARAGAEQRPLAWLAELLERHPDDPGALAPLLLHDRVLEPGEAFFVGPGELHCYLSGVAVELMASSDNVLRGGLTEKHVDLAELLAVLDFRAGEARPLRPSLLPDAEGAARRYATPDGRFALDRLDLDPAAPPGTRRVEGVELLLCVEGRVRIDPTTGAALELGPGRAALVCGGLPSYRVGGHGCLFRASAPAPGGSAGPQT